MGQLLRCSTGSPVVVDVIFVSMEVWHRDRLCAQPAGHSGLLLCDSCCCRRGCWLWAVDGVEENTSKSVVRLVAPSVPRVRDLVRRCCTKSTYQLAASRRLSVKNGVPSRDAGAALWVSVYKAAPDLREGTSPCGVAEAPDYAGELQIYIELWRTRLETYNILRLCTRKPPQTVMSCNRSWYRTPYRNRGAATGAVTTHADDLNYACTSGRGVMTLIPLLTNTRTNKVINSKTQS